jgi:hypothetical protein
MVHAEQESSLLQQLPLRVSMGVITRNDFIKRVVAGYEDVPSLLAAWKTYMESDVKGHSRPPQPSPT